MGATSGQKQLQTNFSLITAGQIPAGSYLFGFDVNNAGKLSKMDSALTLTVIEAGGGGLVDTVVAGTNVSVDSTDPANPIVNVPTIGGQVNTVVAGTNVTVDNTDPVNPVVNVAAVWSNYFTDAGAFTYLTSLLEEFVIGGNASLGAKFGVKGLGATGVTFTAIFFNSAGTRSLQIRDDGSVYNLGGGSSTQNTAFGYSALIANTVAVNNTAIGSNALMANTTGNGNTAVGKGSLENNLDGIGNTGIGGSTIKNNVSGVGNTAIGSSALMAALSDYSSALGYSALEALTTGNRNVGIGYATLASLIDGNFNTAIGNQAGTNNINGSSNVFIGYRAGFYQTGSCKLILSNQLYSDEASENTKSMLYGVFAALPTDQALYINARTINVDDLQVGNATLASGDLYADTAANILASGDLIIARKA